jgi:hypothetical protein
MTDIAQRLAVLIGTAPPDLVAFYEKGELPSYPDSRIHLLPFGEARAYTLDMQGVPVFDRLGLWVLDDANDSSPYAFVSKGPCAGMVMHVSHDDDTRLAFASLPAFLDALRALGEGGGDIDDLAHDPLRLALDAELEALAREGSEDAVFLICAYLPASAPLGEAAQAALLAHGDFFVREALAEHIARHPRAQDAQAARQLAADAHPQVANAGKKATGALRRAVVR